MNKKSICNNEPRTPLKVVCISKNLFQCRSNSSMPLRSQSIIKVNKGSQDNKVVPDKRTIRMLQERLLKHTYNIKC